MDALIRRSRMLLVACAVAAAPAVHARGLPKDLGEPELIDYLETGSEQARAEACVRLGKRRSVAAVAPVGKRVVSDESPKVRRQCVHALAAKSDAATGA